MHYLLFLFTVTRFTKEEMMTFRQPVNILGFMADMTDVISTERLNPVCFERFEPEDVSVLICLVCIYYLSYDFFSTTSGNQNLEHRQDWSRWQGRRRQR